MLMANRQLDEDVETVFLMADEDFAHISSSLIKQIAVMSDDKMLARFIPEEIIPEVRRKLN
jgi:pantetheine-phosphate adenylyltransferase